MDKGVDVDGRNVSILLYADDIVLLSDSEQNLQDMLTYMSNWCFKWKLKLNVDKSNIIHFRPKRIQETRFNFTYGEQHLTLVQHYKYLGIYLDAHLNFELCSNTLSDSAGRALGGVIHKFKSVRDMGFRTFERMFDSGVMSINNYAAEIWGFKDFQACKKIQNRAMRYYLGIHKFAPIAGMQGDLGWMSVRFKRFISTLRFWNRMIAMNDNRLTKHAFINDHTLSRRNWCSDVKYIFDLLDMNPVFDSLAVCPVTDAMATLARIDNQDWKRQILTKPKLRTYRIFKTELETELYVKYHLPRRQRSLLAQFRLGILPLRIETGRYDNTPIENRLCTMCDMNVVENEFHFVIECTRYRDYRNELYNRASFVINDLENMTSADKFSCICKFAQKYLSQFIVKSHERRKNVLYDS